MNKMIPDAEPMEKRWNNKYKYILDTHYFDRKSKCSTGREEFVVLSLFDAIKPMNKWCLEVGANNGITGSNTYQLIKEKGWNSIQIESNPWVYRELTSHMAEFGDRVVCLNRTLTSGFLDDGNHYNHRDDIDSIMRECRMPKNIDYVAIDIDSFDFEVWYNMNQFKPNVVLVEFNPFELDLDVVDYDPSFRLYRYDNKRIGYGGTTLGLYLKLAKEKGYDMLYYELNNAFFVRKEFGKALLK